MKLENAPIMIFDDRCYLCSKFANIVKIISRNKFLIVGHYSDTGIKIKSNIFKNEYDSTRMFWFVTREIAYGGRAAIFPLICEVFLGKARDFSKENFSSYSCDCKTPMAFFSRFKSLLSNSEKIHLPQN